MADQLQEDMAKAAGFKEKPESPEQGGPENNDQNQGQQNQQQDQQQTQEQTPPEQQNRMTPNKAASEAAENEEGKQNQEQNSQQNNQKQDQEQNQEQGKTGQDNEEQQQQQQQQNQEQEQQQQQNTDFDPSTIPDDQKTKLIQEELGYDPNEAKQVLDQWNDVIEELESYKEGEGKEPEFANDFVKSLNDHVKNGGDPVKFAQIQSMDVDNMDPKDAIKRNMEWNNPDLTEEEIEAKINYEYGVSEDEDDENTKAYKSANLKEQGRSAKEQLKKLQTDASVPESAQHNKGQDPQELFDQQVQEFQEKDQQRVQAWEQKEQELVSNFDGIELPIDKNGNTFKFTADKDSLSAAQETFEEMVKNDPSLTVEEQGDQAQEMMKKIFVAQNFDSISQAIAEKVRSEKDREHFEKTNHPGNPNDQQKPTEGQQGPSVMDIIEKGEGFK